MVDLLHIDCMDYMATCKDKQFDLAIVDPPYGMNSNDGSFTKNKYGINRGDNWDCYRPKKEYFMELFRISIDQIIWGANYFISDLRDTKTMIVWDKRIAEGLINYSMVEIAWTSFDKIPSKLFSITSTNLNRIHPTQKPVQLYKWLLKNYAKPDFKIIDTHLGSGSSAIAAYDFGCDFVGMEIDKDYYDAAVKRFENHKLQQTINFG